jgi:hypothetical protein
VHAFEVEPAAEEAAADSAPLRSSAMAGVSPRTNGHALQSTAPSLLQPPSPQVRFAQTAESCAFVQGAAFRQQVSTCAAMRARAPRRAARTRAHPLTLRKPHVAAPRSTLPSFRLVTRCPRNAPTLFWPAVQAKSQVVAVTRALVLIATWYCMSTALSLFNKKVIGRKYGVLGGEPFPAPMLMSSAQFAMQYVFARATHALGARRQLGARPCVGACS